MKPATPHKPKDWARSCGVSESVWRKTKPRRMEKHVAFRCFSFIIIYNVCLFFMWFCGDFHMLYACSGKMWFVMFLQIDKRFIALFFPKHRPCWPASTSTPKHNPHLCSVLCSVLWYWCMIHKGFWSPKPFGTVIHLKPKAEYHLKLNLLII